MPRVTKLEKRIRKDERNSDECDWNADIVSDIINDVAETKVWSNIDKFVAFNLQHDPAQFNLIATHMGNTWDRKVAFDIVRIERIENPELMAAFVFKRLQLRQMKPKMHVKTLTMFHGTTRAATTKIIRQGFDWRLAGNARGEKWGSGTAFSPYPDFAAKFAPLDDGVGCMLMCYVLKRQSMLGSKELEVPDEDCDGTHDDKGKVFVKFDDFTAYPAYRITYEMYRD